MFELETTVAPTQTWTVIGSYSMSFKSIQEKKALKQNITPYLQYLI